MIDNDMKEEEEEDDEDDFDEMAEQINEMNALTDGIGALSMKKTKTMGGMPKPASLPIEV